MSKTPWYSFRNQAAEVELLIYGEVGEGTSSAESLVRQLQTMDGQALTVRINSPGGSIF